MSGKEGHWVDFEKTDLYNNTALEGELLREIICDENVIYVKICTSGTSKEPEPLQALKVAVGLSGGLRYPRKEFYELLRDACIESGAYKISGSLEDVDSEKTGWIIEPNSESALIDVELHLPGKDWVLEPTKYPFLGSYLSISRPAKA